MLHLLKIKEFSAWILTELVQLPYSSISRRRTQSWNFSAPVRTLQIRGVFGGPETLCQTLDFCFRKQ